MITNEVFEANHEYVGQALHTYRVFYSQLLVEEVARGLSARLKRAVPIEWVRRYERGDILLNKREFVTISAVIGQSLERVLKFASGLKEADTKPLLQSQVELLQRFDRDFRQRLREHPEDEDTRARLTKNQEMLAERQAMLQAFQQLSPREQEEFDRRLRLEEEETIRRIERERREDV